MSKIPENILKISLFLNSCKYDKKFNSNGKIQYRSLIIIEKEKKCICFDASYYAHIKLLGFGYETVILSMKGLSRNNLSEKYLVAHSVCLFKINGKLGAIGKHESDLREPIYTTYEQIALSYADFFYSSNNSWLLDYGIETLEDYNDNDYITSQNLISEEVIYKNSIRFFKFEIETIKDYLIKIRHKNEIEVINFLKYIQTGRKI